MNTIEQLRNEIEQIDTLILEKLARRQALSKQIGLLKLQQGKNIIDHAREKKLYAVYESLSEKLNLDKQFVEQLLRLIIAHSRKMQGLDH